MKPNPTEVERIIANALHEDIGSGDKTAELLIPTSTQARLTFKNREALVMCGGEVAQSVFKTLSHDIHVSILANDGQHVPAGSRLILVEGPARAILTAERVALNLLQRCCSVATITSHFVQAVRGTGVTILDTRKTMPGLRELDKYAVRVGGGKNHRFRLDDGILVKDNHIALCGGIKAALEKVNAHNSDALPVVIECDTLAQVEEALGAGAKCIMLDNMDIPSLTQAVQLVAGRASLEASGNVTLHTVRAIAETGVDFISIGRLTHSVFSVDIGLDVELGE